MMESQLFRWKDRSLNDTLVKNLLKQGISE
jgi:hypothetical protein